jgi:SAM-dependent methyltransferase
MIRAAALMERACDLYLIDLFRRLGLSELLREPKTAAELVKEFEFVESAVITLQAMLWRLGTNTDTVKIMDSQSPVQFQRRVEPPDPLPKLDEIRTELRKLGNHYETSLEFIDFGSQQFVTALKDDPELFDRLLSGQKTGYDKLWYRATNEDPLQDIHGKMGAAAIVDLALKGDLLEIGGGTGNGLRHLLERLSQKNQLERIKSYTFTDISLRFIMDTKHRTDGFTKFRINWQFLDINKPFDDQKIQEDSVDIIYGVNAAHVVKNILEFLGQCKRSLRPGGRIVFAERVRAHPMEMAPRELALNLSIYHRTAAKLNPEYRPTHCYLTSENWLKVLGLAGFQDGMILDGCGPSDDPVLRYPVVVVATKAD